MFALMPWTRQPSLLPRTDISEGFDGLFDRLLSGWPMIGAAEWPTRWGLTTEEKDNSFVIRLELPGFEPADVKVELIEDRLVVEAERKEAEAKDADKAERTFARVKRVISLPSGTDLSKVEAIYRNGVLEIHVPRAPEAAGRRIEVKT